MYLRLMALRYWTGADGRRESLEVLRTPSRAEDEIIRELAVSDWTSGLCCPLTTSSLVPRLALPHLS
jgi:hypothetical protein